MATGWQPAGPGCICFANAPGGRVPPNRALDTSPPPRKSLGHDAREAPAARPHRKSCYAHHMFGPSASTPRVKICCIANAAEIALAVAAGASALGLVSAMPSGPGVLAGDIIAHLAMLVPPPVMSVLLTSRVSTADILEQQHCCRASMLQLCDAVTPDTRRGLRDALPGVRIMQVIHVRSAPSIPEAREAAETLMLSCSTRSAAGRAAHARWHRPDARLGNQPGHPRCGGPAGLPRRRPARGKRRPRDCTGEAIWGGRLHGRADRWVA